jgi:hypothetical protein
MNALEKIEILAHLSTISLPKKCDLCRLNRDIVAFGENGESDTCDLCLAHLAQYLPYDNEVNKSIVGECWHYLFIGTA